MAAHPPPLTPVFGQIEACCPHCARKFSFPYAAWSLAPSRYSIRVVACQRDGKDHHFLVERDGEDPVCLSSTAALL